MNATVTLEHGMTFTGKADSEYRVTLGASAAVGGADDGFRPLELMLISLGACTAMDVISILRKKRQQVTGLRIVVDAEQASEHPHVFTSISVHYIVTGVNVERKAVARSIELSETKYCPAQAMLAKAVPVSHSFEILEA